MRSGAFKWRSRPVVTEGFLRDADTLGSPLQEFKGGNLAGSMHWINTRRHEVRFVVPRQLGVAPVARLAREQTAHLLVADHHLVDRIPRRRAVAAQRPEQGRTCVYYPRIAMVCCGREAILDD